MLYLSTVSYKQYAGDDARVGLGIGMDKDSAQTIVDNNGRKVTRFYSYKVIDYITSVDLNDAETVYLASFVEHT